MKVVELAKKQPVKEVIDILKDLLDLAEAGEVRSLCLVADCGAHIRAETTKCSDVFEMLGHLDRLKHVLNKQIDRDEKVIQ